jgi:hypothetical protein
VSEDLDDTLVVPPRPAAAPPTPDHDDTVIGGSRGLVTVETEPIDTASIPAPPGFYAFRVGEREGVIVLDVPAYVGRRPSSPRITSGVLPRLVRVPSPQREVSATHLELRQLGASVIIKDLRSTNGSVVMLPGSVPRKLRQGESVVVSPGTLVDIGDDNVIQILPMQRSGSERQQ